MFDQEQLRSMSADERQQLMCTLAAMDPPGLAPAREGERRRRIVLIVIVICCLVLAAWTGLLAASLPRYYRTGGWRGAWVGFDMALLAAFVATGWAAWATPPDPDRVPDRAGHAAVLVTPGSMWSWTARTSVASGSA